MRTSGSIRTEPDRTEIRTTIRVEYSLISHPMRCRIMVEISISAPIITHMVKVWTIMCSTISTVMVRHTKIKQTTIRVININPETPFPSGYIDWPIEILGTEEPAILCITQYPAKIVVTDIQRFIIIISSTFMTSSDFVPRIMVTSVPLPPRPARLVTTVYNSPQLKEVSSIQRLGT